MSRSSGHAVVVGGGIIGLACAYYLTECGWSVTVVERGEVGVGCSHANCGLVCPSHVLPLAEPGLAWKMLPTLFRRDAPLRIAPRFDPKLGGWLWLFARRCTTEHMLEAGRACQASSSRRRSYTAN